MRNDLVITGCGAVTPAGLGVGPLWQAVAAGRSLPQPVAESDLPRLGARVAGTIPATVEQRFPWPDSRLASMMALAAEEAVAQAGWDDRVLSDPAAGLSAATSKGDIANLLRLRGRWLANDLDGQAGGFPFCWPDGPGTMLARRLCIGGPVVCPVAACSTGASAIIRAAQLITDGDARRVLVVAGDASVMPLIAAAFDRMGVLSSAGVCRPFDRDRDGFVLSEGAAAITLDSAEHAIGRPLARLTGFVSGADPTGLAAQDETGVTLAQLLRILLSRAGLSPHRVALYSAHATATPSNDRVEAAAVQQAFGPHAGRLRVLACKSVLGHLLGAAGLIEAIVAVQAMRGGIHPPVANLSNPDPSCPVRLARAAESADLPAAVCASLGFGGQVSLLAIERQPL